MKFSRLNILVLSGAIGLALVSVNTSGQVERSHIHHGLRVFIDPATGEFQRPTNIPEQYPAEANLLSIASGLLGKDRPAPKETASTHINGGYNVNLKALYRPARQSKTKPGL